MRNSVDKFEHRLKLKVSTQKGTPQRQLKIRPPAERRYLSTHNCQMIAGIN